MHGACKIYTTKVAQVPLEQPLLYRFYKRHTVVRLHLLRIASTLLFDSCLSCRQSVVRLYRRAAKPQKILGFMAHSGGESQQTVGLILQTAGPPLTDSQPSVSFG